MRHLTNQSLEASYMRSRPSSAIAFPETTLKFKAQKKET